MAQWRVTYIAYEGKDNTTNLLAQGETVVSASDPQSAERIVKAQLGHPMNNVILQGTFLESS